MYALENLLRKLAAPIKKLCQVVIMAENGCDRAQTAVTMGASVPRHGMLAERAAHWTFPECNLGVSYYRNKRHNFLSPTPLEKQKGVLIRKNFRFFKWLIS